MRCFSTASLLVVKIVEEMDGLIERSSTDSWKEAAENHC